MMANKIAIMCDGASSGNGGACGVGIVVKNIETQEIILSKGESIGNGTNNYAEYKAIIMALEIAEEYYKKHIISDIVILSDSELVVKQVLGQFRVKNKDLKPYAEKARELFNDLKGCGAKIKIDNIPREYNSEADELAREASKEARKDDIEKDYPFLKRK